MKIACLAWGSLVWNLRDLRISSSWFLDGPPVPIEFARQSSGDRLTLVLGANFRAVPSLWAWMEPADLAEAVENLRSREGTATRKIGVWQLGQVPPDYILEIPRWAKDKGASAVIWTALPPKFQGEDNRVPTIEEALEYLQSLSPEQQRGAEEYIRRAPEQVRTPYRDVFEAHFGWYPE